MVDKSIGDYFISDPDDASFEDDLLAAPVIAAVPQPVAPAAEAPAPAVPPRVVTQPVRVVPAAVPAAPSRKTRLAEALGALMREDSDIQAAALVSLDGFTMASALPAGIEPDRVGAMSAAILGLGERAATELGRGHLSQVFIEGENGYVVLVAAGDHAVLTAMASADAKLGLVLYDMKTSADDIGAILG